VPRNVHILVPGSGGAWLLTQSVPWRGFLQEQAGLLALKQRPELSGYWKQTALPFLLQAWVFVCFNDFNFFHYSWYTVSCQFSTLQPSDPVTHTYIHSHSHIIMLHHKWLDRVPSAICRISLLIHSKGNSWHLFTPDSQSSLALTLKKSEFGSLGVCVLLLTVLRLNCLAKRRTLDRFDVASLFSSHFQRYLILGKVRIKNELECLGILRWL